MKMTVKSGDTVLIIAGKDKGKTGKVTGIIDGKVLVENINMVSKHQKPKSQNDKGGIIRKNAPIEASNVMVVCPVCGKATRVAHGEVNGKKVRICKKCGASLDKEFVKQTKKEAKKAIKAADIKGSSFKVASKKTSAEEKVEKTEVKEEVKKAPVKTTAKSTKVEGEKKTTSKSTTAKAEGTKTSTAKKSSTTKTATTKSTKEGATAPKTTKKSTTAKKETK